MKRTITALIAAATLAGCTASQDMIAAQRDRCTEVGYTPGTTEHAQCTERGTAQQQGTQNAVTGSIVSGAANAAIWGAIF